MMYFLYSQVPVVYKLGLFGCMSLTPTLKQTLGSINFLPTPSDERCIQQIDNAVLALCWGYQSEIKAGSGEKFIKGLLFLWPKRNSVSLFCFRSLLRLIIDCRA